MTADRTGLTPDEIRVVDADVGDPQAGGVCVFLGTTRAETTTDGRVLIALDYEAYVEMAEEQLRDLTRRCRERWPVGRVVLLHRTGRVAVGEASVLVAVGAAHRAEAFDACRWLIDTLKAEVAVWKQEVWADGSTSWVAGVPWQDRDAGD